MTLHESSQPIPGQVSRTASEIIESAARVGNLKGKEREHVPVDTAEVGEKPDANISPAPSSSGSTLVTDEERGKAPAFCDLKKVVTPKGELLYVGWDG